MSKYENMNSEFVPMNLEKIIVEGEEVIWSGKPKNQLLLLIKF